MTVNETLAAPPPTRGPAAESTGETRNPQTVEAATAATSGGQTMVVNAKVNQEVMTSLKLIKDIRSLEKYQRNMFLKVRKKEAQRVKS